MCLSVGEHLSVSFFSFPFSHHSFLLHVHLSLSISLLSISLLHVSLLHHSFCNQFCNWHYIFPTPHPSPPPFHIFIDLQSDPSRDVMVTLDRQRIPTQMTISSLLPVWDPDTTLALDLTIVDVQEEEEETGEESSLEMNVGEEEEEEEEESGRRGSRSRKVKASLLHSNAPRRKSSSSSSGSASIPNSGRRTGPKSHKERRRSYLAEKEKEKEQEEEEEEEEIEVDDDFWY